MPAPLIDYMSIKETNDVAEAWDEYKSIFENSLVGIVRTEISTGKILRLNSRAAEMYGYRSPDEVIGRFTKEFFPIPSERKALAEMLAHKGEVSNYQLQLRRKDGSTYWIAFYKKINPKEGVFDSIAVDISYQKAAETRLEVFHDILTHHIRNQVQTIKSAFELYSIVRSHANDDEKQLRDRLRT